MPSYKGHRYPVEIINHCVWLYFRFPLSFREVEELMLERGVAVSYETIRRWCAKFGQAYASGPGKLRRWFFFLGIRVIATPRLMVPHSVRPMSTSHHPRLGHRPPRGSQATKSETDLRPNHLRGYRPSHGVRCCRRSRG
jgi:hypothetical protein